MKKTFLFILLAAALNIFASCAQNRQLVENPPFTITDSHYTSWISQQPKNSSGMDIFLTITNKTANITLKSVFFKGKSAVFNQESDGVYAAHFTSVKENPDYIIAADTNKEINNPKPQLPEQPPIEILPNEALLVYLQNGKEKFYKLKNLKDKGTKYPAEAPFNKNN